MGEEIYGRHRKMKASIVLLTFLGFASCMRFEAREEAGKKNLAFSLMEDYLARGASFEDVKKTLGEPARMYKHEGKSFPEIYVYNNKVNNFKEWSFAVNEKGEVIWLNYMPWDNSLFDRVEVFPETWKKYRCKRKTRPDKRVAHVIRKHTFFECAGGKIRAYYNIHGEIGTIVVER